MSESDSAFRWRIIEYAKHAIPGLPTEVYMAIGADLDAIGAKYHLRRGEPVTVLSKETLEWLKNFAASIDKPKLS